MPPRHNLSTLERRDLNRAEIEGLTVILADMILSHIKNHTHTPATKMTKTQRQKLDKATLQSETALEAKSHYSYRPQPHDAKRWKMLVQTMIHKFSNRIKCNQQNPNDCCNVALKHLIEQAIMSIQLSDSVQ